MIWRHRRRAIMIAMAATLTALPVWTAQAGGFGGLIGSRSFLGLWEGVDPLDGSTVYASITDIDRDGILEMAQGESFFTFCAQLDANHSFGRGMISGEGKVQRGVYKVVTSFTCIDDDGKPGEPLVGPFDYTLEEGGKLLRVPGDGDTIPDVLLHRIVR
jgi:hypothetical protein